MDPPGGGLRPHVDGSFGAELSLGAREKEHAEHLLCPRAQRARLAPSQDECLDLIVWKHASRAFVE